MLFILLAGIALSLILFAGLRRLEARRQCPHRTGAGDIPRPGRAQTRGAGRRRARDRRRHRRRRPRLGSVLPVQLRHPVPRRPQAALRRPRRRRPPRLLAGGDRLLRRKAASSAMGPGPTSSPGSSIARSSCRCTTPTRSTSRRFAELGVVGGLLVLGLIGSLLWCGFAPGATRCPRNASATRRCWRRCSPSRSAPPSTGSGRSPGWACSSSSPPAWWSPPAATRSPPTPDASQPRAASAATAWPSPEWCSPGSRRSPWSGRCWSSARSTPARPPRRTKTSAARSTTPTPPARSSPGPLRRTCSSACSPSARAIYPAAIDHFTDAIEREDRNWQWYYLRSRVEHAAGGEPAALADLERARELNPRSTCLQGEWAC